METTGKRWFCLYSKRVPELRNPDPQALREHLLYVKKLHDEGKLFASGPVPGSSPSGPPGDGFHVLAVSDRAEAEAIAAADPFHVRGYRTWQLWPWEVHWLGPERFGIPASILRLAGLGPDWDEPEGT
jgi:uncharacterized protein YciI